MAQFRLSLTYRRQLLLTSCQLLLGRPQLAPQRLDDVTTSVTCALARRGRRHFRHRRDVAMLGAVIG